MAKNKLFSRAYHVSVNELFVIDTFMLSSSESFPNNVCEILFIFSHDLSGFVVQWIQIVWFNKEEDQPENDSINSKNRFPISSEDIQANIAL